MAHELVTFPAHAHDAFPHKALERISKTIEQVEKSTSAEIRISIRDSRETSEAGLEIKDLALKEFTHLGMEKTANRSGILLFILYDERKFYICGDEGIHKRSNPDAWEDVASVIKSHFRHAEFEKGVEEGLKKILTHVRDSDAHTPHNHELSSDVVIQ
jgi:uncharacterized membrane protein